MQASLGTHLRVVESQRESASATQPVGSAASSSFKPARPRKTRSFTLAKPPTTTTRPVRQPVKRSKTFTGCWTCRSRGLKCDEGKPECDKCLRFKVPCEGYHVRLVWDCDDTQGGQSEKRRTILTDHDARQPVLSSRDIRLALEELDASEAPVSLQAGPFTVFAAQRQSEQEPDTDQLQDISYSQSPLSNLDEPGLVLGDQHTDFGVITQARQPDLEHLDFDLIRSGEEDLSPAYSSTGEHENIKHWVDGTAIGGNDNGEVARIMTSIKQRVLPQIRSYLSSATLEERSLFHYWVTVLSGLMIPTQRHDNPFRTIFVPLALTKPDSNSASSGNVALLHAIYSVSAFNLARLSPASERLITLGTKHHKLALGHLRRNLMHHDQSQREAVLATIITMSSIEVIKGDSSSWRTHLAGGRVLLQSLMKEDMLQSTTVLCQIFFCINALAVSSVPIETERNIMRTFDQWTDRQSFEAEMEWPIWHNSYALDGLFGISKPVLEAIVRINALSNPASNATTDEIDELDRHIRCNDPDVMVTDMIEYDEITRHHTCAFFCACLIYFERRLRRTHPCRIQRLVQRSLDHLEAIRGIEKDRNLDVCGIFWPEFVTACEAEEANNMRTRAICLFDKGDLRGIGNIQSAEQVVLEIWRRRDSNPEDVDINWHSVMADLGLDLILT